MLPARLQRLEHRTDGTVSVFVANTFATRLLGLAFLAEEDAPTTHALLLPRCSSVHTFGMRFALDISFLDAQGSKLRTAWNVPPRRIVRQKGAAAVLERRSSGLRSGLADECLQPVPEGLEGEVLRHVQLE